MNINRRVLTLTGTLLLTGAFMQAAMGAQDSTVRFEVLSEGPRPTTATSASVSDGAATATWQGDDRIVITTVGYQDCPVLPATITTAGDVLTISLTAVPSGQSCGTSLESFTTVIRLDDSNEHQALQLQVREERV